MASRVVMPKLTDTMEEGVVVKWKKHEGEEVATGDVLAEIETDKAVMDLEAFSSGTLRKLLVKEGQTVPAGGLIAVIAEPDEDIQPVLAGKDGSASVVAQKSPAALKEKSAKSEAPTAPQETKPAVVVPGERIKASPRAKSAAAAHRLDLATVRGTGPGGRIVEEDVRQAVSGQVSWKEPQPMADREIPLTQMRKAIARTTTQSKAPVPHFYLTTEIAMDEAERVRAQLKQLMQPPPSLTDVILKALAQALVRYPDMNVSYAGDSLRQHGRIDIGIAVGLDDGLISPVLRDCGNKTLSEIAKEAKPLIERARTKRLQPQEYSDATFAVSNLGMFDVENFIAVLMPPQAAALAVGSVREVPVVQGGRIRIGRRMKATRSCDHRALDGMQAAKFLKEVKRLLEHPLELVLPGDRR